LPAARPLQGARAFAAPQRALLLERGQMLLHAARGGHAQAGRQLAQRGRIAAPLDGLLDEGQHGLLAGGQG
jgi:hypothetical protein